VPALGTLTRTAEMELAAPGAKSLLPREHGAYGQITLPLATAFAAAGVSPAGVWLAAAATAAFLAHEPALVLLGARGPRARRELQRCATRWLAVYVAAAMGAGVAALVTMDADARWSVAVPLAPAALVAIAAWRGREKSWYGEVAASLAFAGAAFPVALAAGAPWPTAAATAVPFALLFVVSTLAVRAVILRVRGGGNLRATTLTRRTVLALAFLAASTLAAITTAAVLPVSVLGASMPGLLAAVGIAVRPPPPARLRALGWSLVAVSIVTALIVVATA
jgi:hypothetical protein